jgi:metallo-beta-lactamase family protein
MNARLRFHGAAQEVTGSMHLVEANGRLIALDCGLFHGRRAEAEQKNRSFPCKPTDIDAVVLSHAHIDHCGKLPRLVRDGFRGPIYATPPTCDLVELLLADSAHIQEEDAAYWNKKRVRRGDAPIEPLYTADDAAETFPLLQRQRIGETFDVAGVAHVTFHEAGHMLGSAMVELDLRDGESDAVRIVYTGDLGRPGRAILRDPAPLPMADYLICESTYGGRNTPDNEGMGQQLADIINRAIDRGGKIIVPAFAVGRTQVIVYHYHTLLKAGLIKRPIPIIVDSPLASRATDVFRRHPEVFDEEAKDFRRDAGSLFRSDWAEYTRSVEDSKALHRRNEPMIIVSASGMCEFGRILHHLKNNIADARNTVIIVGYQAHHTLGRRLVEREKQVRIFGEMYDVKAEIRVLNGFSAHANASELIEWTVPMVPECRKAFLIHGEPDQSEKLAASMRERGFRKVVIPESGQSFQLAGNGTS